MASAKTWLWILVGIIGVCLLGLFALAGAGVYFVSRHVGSERTTSADALRSFDERRAAFKDAHPLIEFDSMDQPHASRSLSEMPTSATRPTDLRILVWEPNDERLVKISLPFWMLRLGRRKLNFVSQDRNLDLDRLNLDVPELERVGPQLVVDYRAPSGERVLVWTQ
jgi:hypothetical protein